MRFDHEDWFSRHIPNWENWLAHLKGVPNVRAIEIGSFEGRSACWLAENILTGDGSFLVCIDPFTDEGMTAALTGTTSNQVYSNFLENTAPFQQIQHIRGLSRKGLYPFKDGSIDFIYIDGSHLAVDVLTDALLAWPLLKPGGTLILDDYTWTAGMPEELPKVAIDIFLSLVVEHDLLNLDHQVRLRKWG